MIAGAWLLAAVPLLSVLTQLGWLQHIPAWAVGDARSSVSSVGDTFLVHVYVGLVFCMGVVLLFAKERGRQASRLDWTRRWGVLFGYVWLLLFAVGVLFFVALVLVGLGALFHSLPPANQPAYTETIISIATNLIYYGPQGGSATV